MFKKSLLGLVSVAVMVVLAGCATGRNYESDINALNAKVNSLQSQVSSKDEELAKLQNQLKNQEMSNAQSETERRALNDRLNAAAEELAATKAREAAAKTVKKATPAYDSDLK